MKIIDSQFLTTQKITITLIFYYVFLNLTPLVAQMLIQEKVKFLVLTCIFTFTNIFPFAIIEFIQIRNHKKTGYFSDPWNFLESLNIVSIMTYSVISFIYQSELVEMNVIYTDESTP